MRTENFIENSARCLRSPVRRSSPVGAAGLALNLGVRSGALLGPAGSVGGEALPDGDFETPLGLGVVVEAFGGTKSKNRVVCGSVPRLLDSAPLTSGFLDSGPEIEHWVISVRTLLDIFQSRVTIVSVFEGVLKMLS